MYKNEELVAEASVAIDDAALAATFEAATESMRGLFAQARTAGCARDYVRALACAPGAGSIWAQAAEAAGHTSPGRFQALLREAV